LIYIVLDGRRNNGGNSTKSTKPVDGRKKPDAQKLLERVGLFDDEALDQLGKAVKKGEKWAIELWAKYRLGLPTQKIEANIDSVEKIVPPWMLDNADKP